MAPTVAIIEPHRDFAVALQEIVALAHCTPVTMSDFDELTQLPSPPAAIVLRITPKLPFDDLHVTLKDLPALGHPKIFALASNDADVAEAERLGCDVVLREPQQVRALYDALIDMATPVQGHPND